MKQPYRPVLCRLGFHSWMLDSKHHDLEFNERGEKYAQYGYYCERCDHEKLVEYIYEMKPNFND